MNRELLIEIGCEELPASWLPSLTRQIGELAAARLTAVRLDVRGAIQTFSTPRRLTVFSSAVADRQSDLEELVTGPPASAAFGSDGRPTPAALGFARKHGVDVSALDRIETSKGIYLSHRKREPGRLATAVLPDVLAGVLRDLSFPKPMRWDAWLDDGHGELLFGRAIRWILFLYGGEIVPFTIKRSHLAQSAEVRDVRSGAATYGHRFLAAQGQAGAAVEVRSFEDYRSRLLERCVLLDRQARRDRIAHGLATGARELGGLVSGHALNQATLLEEVPDLVEFPSVVAGTFAKEFLNLPEEVLTTTMIHHQHYFPVTDEAGRLLPAFLAVVNTMPDREGAIARNAERVLAARLRDARFFWDTDRKIPFASRVNGLETIQFHKTLGSYRQKAERIERLAGQIATDVFERPDAADRAAEAARLAKADLTTGMVRELTELQGTMGGIYAREQGWPEEVWKAIYYHYLPIGVEADAPPSLGELGSAASTWAAVALADKLDTVVGMFSAGERPTGSRDPFGLRRQANGIFKILVDLPELTGLAVRPTMGPLLDAALRCHRPFDEWEAGDSLAFFTFLLERLRYVLEQRGFDIRNVRAVTHGLLRPLSPVDARRKLEVLPEFTGSADFQRLAVVFKRVKNMAKELPLHEFELAEIHDPALRSRLTEPAERALLKEIDRRGPVIDGVLAVGEDYRRAFTEAAAFGPTVDRFFTDVFVMVDNPQLRTARLWLMRRLEALILKVADVSEIVPETES